jgi:hypothetical protein
LILPVTKNSLPQASPAGDFSASRLTVTRACAAAADITIIMINMDNILFRDIFQDTAFLVNLSLLGVLFQVL